MATANKNKNRREETTSNETLHLREHETKSTATNDNKQALGHFPRKKLKTIKTWPEWKQTDLHQLYQYRTLETYDEPQRLPHDSNLLRPHWYYHVKRDKTRRSRYCADGS